MAFVDGRHGIAFAGDLGGDALVDLRGQAGIDEHGQLGLAKHVNESRRDDLAGGVDGLPARRSGQVADGGDAARADADVARVPGRAAAVDDVAVGDDQVKKLCTSLRRRLSGLRRRGGLGWGKDGCGKQDCGQQGKGLGAQRHSGFSVGQSRRGCCGNSNASSRGCIAMSGWRRLDSLANAPQRSRFSPIVPARQFGFMRDGLPGCEEPGGLQFLTAPALFGRPALESRARAASMNALPRCCLFKSGVSTARGFRPPTPFCGAGPLNRPSSGPAWSSCVTRPGSQIRRACSRRSRAPPAAGPLCPVDSGSS